MATLILHSEDLIDIRSDPTPDNFKIDIRTQNKINTILYKHGNETIIIKKRYK